MVGRDYQVRIKQREEANILSIHKYNQFNNFATQLSIYNMKALTTILFISLLSGYHAQQETFSSMFWNNYTLFNPAATGLFYKHQANVMYRDQWDKVNGAPRTFTANYNTKLDFLHGGIGANYVHDKIGFTNTDRINLNYSYHLQLGKEGVLAAGISAGLIHSATDPSLPYSSQKGNAFTMNFGLVYKTERLNIGLSSTNLNEPTIKKLYYSFARHYYLNADYLFELTPHFDLKPANAGQN